MYWHILNKISNDEFLSAVEVFIYILGRTQYDIGHLAALVNWLVCFFTANPLQGDLRHSGLSSGQGAGDGTRTSDRMIPVDQICYPLSHARPLTALEIAYIYVFRTVSIGLRSRFPRDSGEFTQPQRHK
ncbi:hypothetical protein PoB_004853200 [Plakobranchus ocellatus]|uniref:Uncharacterized protein n=1 Tax=Plakobranchus ocellatus TaxID=259542 RepID=A0AAV4BRN6_9GAST|nr:hypothetical protein PoB_004853200 [Plakobranchus ocellatus]